MRAAATTALWGLGASRGSGEIALRRAVGAPRRTLLATALAEDGLLAGLALGLGAALPLVFAPRRRFTDASSRPVGLTVPSVQPGRRAVGATRPRVLGLVLLRAVRVGMTGTAAGLALGPAVWGALGTIVRGLPAWDTALVLRFAALLVGTSVAGALLPAWRAARAEPARLLAAE